MRRRPRRQAVRIREPGRTRSAMVSRIRTAPSRPRHPIGQSASRIDRVYHKYPLLFLDPTLQGDGRNFRTKPRLHLPASKEHCEISRVQCNTSVSSRAPQARRRRAGGALASGGGFVQAQGETMETGVPRSPKPGYPRGTPVPATGVPLFGTFNGNPFMCELGFTWPLLCLLP